MGGQPFESGSALVHPHPGPNPNPPAPRHNLPWLLAQCINKRNLAIEGLPGSGKTFLLQSLASAFRTQHSWFSYRYGAIRGLVAAISRGETLCSLFDLAAKWPGRQRDPLGSKVSVLRKMLGVGFDEGQELSGMYWKDMEHHVKVDCLRLPPASSPWCRWAVHFLGNCLQSVPFQDRIRRILPNGRLEFAAPQADYVFFSELWQRMNFLKVKLVSQHRFDAETMDFIERGVKGLLTRAQVDLLRSLRRSVDAINPAKCLVLVTLKSRQMYYHNELFIKQRRLHDTSAAGQAAAASDLLPDDHPTLPLHIYGAVTDWRINNLEDRQFVEETAMPLWESVHLRINAKVIVLVAVPSKAHTILTGMTGIVIGFQHLSANDLRTQLRSRYNITDTAELNQAIDNCRIICGSQADNADDEFIFPEVRLVHPGNGKDYHTVVMPTKVDVYSKEDEQLVCSRWALPIGGGWAVKFGQALGCTVNSVWCDVEGRKLLQPSDEVLEAAQDPAAAAEACSPEPLLGVSRVRRIRDCYWAPSTDFSSTMFKAPDAVLQYFYRTSDWIEVEIPNMPHAQQNHQPLAV